MELEATHPEVLQAILAKLSPMFPTDEDGTLRTTYGKAIWKPHDPDVLLRTYNDYTFSYPTAASLKVAGAEFFHSFSAPFCSEIAQPMLDVIAATPTSGIAQSCEPMIGLSNPMAVSMGPE
eukprot:SAG31_NODE_26123_length_448_cov_0.630372_1_plen_121_part_00